MKRFIVFCSILFCGVAVAQQITVNWLNEDGTNITTSTCTVGGGVTLPNNIPQKRGYTFHGFVDNYTPVQYIESGGAQWIDSNWATTSNIRVKTKFYLVTAAAAEGVFGYGSTYSFLCGINTNRNLTFIWYSTTVASSVTLAAGDMVELDWNKKHVTYSINGTEYEADITSSYNPPNGRIYLFRTNGATSQINRPANIRLYYFQIYNGDVLVRDFIPVTDSAGTPCLFDRVTKKFYYNGGIGDFVAGVAI